MPPTIEPLSPTMPTPAPQPPASPAASPQALASPAADRLASVDALRGLVMFTMLFVNDVAGVRGVPGWMKHYPASGNGMTFVDWVFPAFLFIVGLSIPLAFQRRLVRGERTWRLIVHVIVRTAGLLLLGVFMVNAERDPAPAGWPQHLWELLVYLFGIIAFLAPLGRTPRARVVGVALRVIGFGGFVLLAVIFRDDEGNWMRTSWWGILGLIGWAYFVAAILYLLLRRAGREWMIAAVALLIVMYLADKKGAFDGVRLDRYVDFGAHLGSHAAIAMAGVILGTALLGQAHRAAARYGLALGGVLAIGAWLMYPLHGINKNAATPAWCLISAALTCWLWAVLALPIDRLGVVRPLRFFIRGGQNVLLAYLLMPLFLHFIWMTGLTFYGKFGAASPAVGITRALVAAAVVLWLAGFLKDRGVRLRL